MWEGKITLLAGSVPTLWWTGKFRHVSSAESTLRSEMWSFLFQSLQSKIQASCNVNSCYIGLWTKARIQEKLNTDITNSCDISIMLISLLFYFRIIKTCHNMCLISGQSWLHWRSSRDNATSLGLVILKRAKNPKPLQVLGGFLWKPNAEGHRWHFSCPPRHVWKTHAKRANRVNIDLEKDQAQQEHWGVALHPMFLVVYVKFKEMGSYIHSSWKDSIAFVFLFWLRSSPPPCTFFFFNCFLPLAFFFLFANSYPFTRNPQDVVPTFTTLLTLPQNIEPCSQLVHPAAEGVIIVKIKISGTLLSSSLILRTCDQAPGSCRAGLTQRRCAVIWPPGPCEGAGPVQWRVLSPLSAPCVKNHP